MPKIELTDDQMELLALMAGATSAYRTKTAEGSGDLMKLGMLGFASDIFELGNGRFSGRITQAGRLHLIRNSEPF